MVIFSATTAIVMVVSGSTGDNFLAIKIVINSITVVLILELIVVVKTMVTVACCSDSDGTGPSQKHDIYIYI